MKLYNGNCLEVMPTLDENSIDTIITDPPYGLEFMGKDWDKGVPGVLFWREALRVAKPGATLLAMGGTRTFHRLVCAIEDAGWEIRDTIAYIYGSGFPKSYDISKGMDRAAGAEREVVGHYLNPDGHIRTAKQGYKKDYVGGSIEDSNKYLDGDLGRHITAPATPEAQQWDGWGTALKPALELVCVAQKPREGTYVENALKWGVSGLWIDGGRVPLVCETSKTSGGRKRNRGVTGWQPSEGYDEKEGRWPANVIHDGSDEVMDGFPSPHGAGSEREAGLSEQVGRGGLFGVGNHDGNGVRFGDSGSAARFFYCAKSSRSERNAGLEDLDEKFKEGANFRPNHMEKALEGDTGNPYGRWGKIQNHHPTVKPIALMQYLARLTKTPTGGVVLDPFMGSGTTGIACVNEGRDFIGIEQNDEYLEIARRRIEYAVNQKLREQPRLL